MRCFEGITSSVDVLVDRVRNSVASWATSPLFHGIFMVLILMDWKEVAFSPYAPSGRNPSWSPHPVGFLKLNFDSSASGNSDPAGIGASFVIAMHLVSSIMQFQRSPAGHCLTNKAESLALRMDLQEASTSICMILQLRVIPCALFNGCWVILRLHGAQLMRRRRCWV